MLTRGCSTFVRISSLGMNGPRALCAAMPGLPSAYPTPVCGPVCGQDRRDCSSSASVRQTKYQSLKFQMKEIAVHTAGCGKIEYVGSLCCGGAGAASELAPAFPLSLLMMFDIVFRSELRAIGAVSGRVIYRAEWSGCGSAQRRL